MKPALRWTAVGIAAAGIAAALVLRPWEQAEAPRPAPPPRVDATPKPAPDATPKIGFPVPADTAPLPALEQSDSALREALAALFGRKAFETLFGQQDIVRRIVATVDNLAREKAAQRLMPVLPAKGPFATTGAGESLAIDARNAARYAPQVELASSVDTAALVAAYVRHYPLFQQAYRELGYPAGYFNDRLVQVIDHLLATPDATVPVRLVQRKVLFEFADPELETRSAGQKILLRIGPENAARMKARLKDIRRALTTLAPGS